MVEKTCSECNGQGNVPCEGCKDFHEQRQANTSSCSACHGTKKLKCGRCGGTGKQK
jgi:hypothetical protein